MALVAEVRLLCGQPEVVLLLIKQDVADFALLLCRWAMYEFAKNG